MPLTIYRRPGGRIWHYRGTVAGRLLRRSTKTTDKDTAQRIANEVETRHWKGHLDGPEAVLTFGQAATLYCDATKQTRYIPKLLTYWRDTPVKDIKPGAVRQCAKILYPKAANATLNRQVIVPMQAIVNHAAEAELCHLLKVRRFKVEKKSKEPATWEWVKAFMAHANPHLGALACFMYLTGARISEALSVTWEDIDFTTRRVLIRQTKIGEERRAHMPSALIAAIANIKGERNPNRRVFRYVSRVSATPEWRKVVKRAGIKKLTPHSCRHGFATGMLHKGVDPVTTAKRGGWKSAAHVFATYGHALEDETVTDRLVEEIDTPEAQAPENASKKTKKTI